MNKAQAHPNLNPLRAPQAATLPGSLLRKLDKPIGPVECLAISINNLAFLARLANVQANQEKVYARPTTGSSMRMSFNPSHHRFVPAGSSLRHSNRGDRVDLSSSSRRKEAQISAAWKVESAKFKSETPYVVSYEPPFRKVLIRNNIIRYVDNQTDPGRNLAIAVFSGEDVIIEHNTVDLVRLDQIQHRDCTHVHYFHNTKPDGSLVQGGERPVSSDFTKQPELTTAVEDALLLSLL